MNGLPAAGLRLDLYAVAGRRETLLATYTTNTDGRVDEPLLSGAGFKTGTYRLDFHAGDYLQTSDFLDVIPVQFIINNTERHYHVPLLLSAYGYSTYRGS